MKTKYLITGVTGQMGSIAADHLCALENCEVFGLIRTSTQKPSNPINEKVNVVEGDLNDINCLYKILEKIKPGAILHYAAQSQVGTSFKQPCSTFQTNAIGSLNLLEAIKHKCPQARSVFLATSEMFGNSWSRKKRGAFIQDERTIFKPVSVYGVSKLSMYWNVINYRETYKLPICCAIQFNSESPRRHPYFVTRKITKYVAGLTRFLKSNNIELTSDETTLYKGGSFPKLQLGNLNVWRDWSDADDSVEAHIRILWSMLNDKAPKEYCIGSGESHSLKEFLKLAFEAIEITDFRPYIYQNPVLKRPNELYRLCSDPTKIQVELGWQPKSSFYDLINKMLGHDLYE